MVFCSGMACLTLFNAFETWNYLIFANRGRMPLMQG